MPTIDGPRPTPGDGSLPPYVRAIAHDHDTPTGSYIPGCLRCDTEQRLIKLRRQAEREHPRG